MRRDLAWRKWRLPVVWLAGEEFTAAAEPVKAPRVIVHYHLHLAPGMTARTALAALPLPRGAITTEESEN